MTDLSDREKAIGAVCLGLGAAAGLWLGLWTVPDKALSVPMNTMHDGTLNPAYKPVTTFHLLLTFGLPALGAWYSRHLLVDDDLDDDLDDTSEGVPADD